MEKQKRNFKGIWIPASIWLNTDLSAVEKILYAEINSFTSNDSSCYKSNKTLAEEMQVSESTIKRAIKQLEAGGYIWVERKARSRVMSTNDLSGMVQLDLLEGHNDTHKAQNDLVSGSNCTPSNTVTKTVSKTITISMPFDSNNFVYWWDTWKQERKDRKYKAYTQRGEQGALHKLTDDARGDENVAIQMIQQSIVNGWRGLFPLKSQNHKNESVSQSFDRNKLQSYLESLGND